MDILTIQATVDSPSILFDRDKGILRISGNSYPDDPTEIYEKVKKWLEEYVHKPNNNTLLEFKLNYINSASSRQIADILRFLENSPVKHNVGIKWCYQSFDDDMYYEGKELESLFKLKFDFFEY